MVVAVQDGAGVGWCEHLLDVGRVHAAFVADARARGEDCGPLDLLPARALPAGELVYFLPRHRIEGRDASAVATGLQGALDEFGQ
ncbi:hypothetical protein ACIRD3_36940 [Kitasatospora sp. NPDC093550]|uniref:hypothetical protein n=1 Tax=Kitasatospora sp. NPDC093550 TaxID=3364089 RepID=UPI00382B5FB4